MARPRSFDEDSALDAATARFWSHGFAGSSTRELGAAMGLGPASLYNAFGDKQALFARCLDRYLDANMRARIRRAETGFPPRQAIESFLAESVERSLKDPRGCLLVNSAVEIAPHDGATGALVAERLSELEGFFRRCIAAGQRDGTIQSGRDAGEAAALMLTVVMGLRVLARARPDRAVLEGAARQALALLDPSKEEHTT